MSLQDAPSRDRRVSNHMKSDPEVPIDPSIAQQQQQSPTYPPPYSPYNPQAHEMAQYQGHPPPGMYQPRPDGWGGQYGHPAHMQGPYQSPATSVPNASPNVTAGGRPGQVRWSREVCTAHPFPFVCAVPRRVSDRLQQVYSFVPIPGAQQHKRPRRRYEEIERMYKCGWQGCEKAYGTLNHLNAHVTMQSHGNKRTPEGMPDSLFCSSARHPFGIEWLWTLA
jgi:transcription factor CON7